MEMPSRTPGCGHQCVETSWWAHGTGEGPQVVALKDWTAIVVDTPLALLVCPASDEQWIKELVGDLKRDEGEPCGLRLADSAATDHVAQHHPRVVLLFGQVPCGQGAAFNVVPSAWALQFCRLVVPNLGVQRRDQHQAVVDQLGDSAFVGLDAIHTMCRKRMASVTEKAGRLQMFFAIMGLKTLSS